LCTKKELEWFGELESFLRYLIFEDQRWRPATNTSVMITLNPKDGMRRRYWVNGNLIGMRESLPNYNGNPIMRIRETCLMIERRPQFPTLQSLEEYVRSRMPYEDIGDQEVHCIADQIHKRFFVVGRSDVREFYLKRKIRFHRNNRRIVISLRWDIPRESWGYSSWRAYFEEDSRGRLYFATSRVSCHIYLTSWLREGLPQPWKFPILAKGGPPTYHKHITTHALTWLQICRNDTMLRKPAVILSIEDDPVSGMPEDNPDGLSLEALDAALNFLPPEQFNGI